MLSKQHAVLQLCRSSALGALITPLSRQRTWLHWLPGLAQAPAVAALLRRVVTACRSLFHRLRQHDMQSKEKHHT